MAIHIHKLTNQHGQYKLTLPKKLVEEIGLDKVDLIEIWETENKIIHVREYYARKRKRR